MRDLELSHGGFLGVAEMLIETRRRGSPRDRSSGDARVEAARRIEDEDRAHDRRPPGASEEAGASRLPTDSAPAPRAVPLRPVDGGRARESRGRRERRGWAVKQGNDVANGASKPLASISLDLDNLWSYMKIHGDAGWARSLVPGSSVEIVVDRFRAHGLTGDDLRRRTRRGARQERAAMRAIADAGHEIGNHSFSHEPWFHTYSYDQDRDARSPTPRRPSSAPPGAGRGDFADPVSASAPRRCASWRSANTSTMLRRSRRSWDHWPGPYYSSTARTCPTKNARSARSSSER